MDPHSRAQTLAPLGCGGIGCGFRGFLQEYTLQEFTSRRFAWNEV
jgi:hypothetical protein